MRSIFLEAAEARTVSIAAFTTAIEICRLRLEVKFSGGDTRRIEKIVDQSRLEPRITFDCVQSLRNTFLVERSASQ